MQQAAGCLRFDGVAFAPDQFWITDPNWRNGLSLSLSLYLYLCFCVCVYVCGTMPCDMMGKHTDTQDKHV